MQALTRRGKRELPRDVEDEDGPGGEMLVRILAQGAQRREAAEEHKREGEQTGNRVGRMVFSHWSTILNISKGAPVRESWTGVGR